MSIATDLSLDWVTFTSQEPGEPCMARWTDCPAQATHLAVFRLVKGDCQEHGCKTYCLQHADELLSRQHITGYFRCTCEPPSRWALERVEPLS